MSRTFSATQKPLLVANWKMHKTCAAVRQYVERLRAALAPGLPAEVVLCPAFPHLETARRALDGAPVALGAQDLFWEDGEGAYTGEVSAAMLLDLGVSHVIVGHSERRRILAEGETWVSRKVRAAAGAGLTVLLCVGEDAEEREEGRTDAVVTNQLEAALGPLDPAARRQVIIAYEPLWAIGSGRPSRPRDAAAVAALIREWLAGRGAHRAGPAVLYGGSVNPDNVAAYVQEAPIDGALVGGASLAADRFARLAAAAAGAAPGRPAGDRQHE